MIFKELSSYDVESVRCWRNKTEGVLRTPYMLTEEMQAEFYDKVICNRNSNSRFWAICDDIDDFREVFIGMVGLENIEWENGIAEISIILSPYYSGKGFGTKAIDMLLKKGFNELRLNNIYGEVYQCNTAIEFWKKIIKKYNGHQCWMPNRKYFKGRYYSSLYFSISINDYMEAKK